MLPKPSEQSRSFCVNNSEISYSLQKSRRRRTLAIMIKEDGCVKVYAPHHASDEKIQAFLKQKSDWILEGIEKMSARSRWKAQRQPAEDGFLFFGTSYPVDIQEDSSRQGIHFSDAGWKVFVPQDLSGARRTAWIRGRLERWLRRQAEEYLAVRTFKWARVMELDVAEIQVRTQKRLWGCCYPTKRKIHFNWRIIQAPVEVIDYVIIHELCHLWEANHSQRFWLRVRKFCPDYLSSKAWLKQRGFELQ